LPNHSLFGQSFGDLDGYKSERSDAVAAIRESAHSLAALKQEQVAVQTQIGALKAVVKRRRELLEQGLRVPALRRHLQRTNERREEQLELLRRMEESRDALLAQAWHQSGAQSLHEAISKVEQARRESIANFDAPEQKERRRREHRATFTG
jgi:hypothetical protein